MTSTQALRHIGIVAAAALLVTAVSIKPVAVHAMGTDTPYPTTDDDGKKKKKKSNMIEQQRRPPVDPRRQLPDWDRRPACARP